MRLFRQPIFPRGIPLRFALTAVVIGLLLSTTAVIAAVSYINVNNSVQELAESLFKEVSRQTANEVRARLEPASLILREQQGAVSRKLVDVDDLDALGERLVERLRFQPDIAWLSYSDTHGEFVGAHRKKAASLQKEELLLNRSSAPPIGTLKETLVYPDGKRVVFRQLHNWTYDPRERPFYQLAAASEDVVWTKPYPWWDEEGLGVTCALAIRDGEQVRGVFTTDYHLLDLSRFLQQLRIGATGHVYIVDQDAHLVAGPQPSQASADQMTINAAVAHLPGGLQALTKNEVFPVAYTHDGVRYLATAKVFEVTGGLKWATVVVVPAKEVLGGVWSSTTWTIVIAGVSLLAAMLLGSVLSTLIAKPLNRVTAELKRVGQFELAPQTTTPARFTEVRVIEEATERMKAGLRSFAHYVPTEVVRKLIASGEEAALGAEPRVLTIYFADIEGFTRISEQMEPSRLVDSLGQYFDRMKKILTGHNGTLDKFIGDGVLAFFNAPQDVQDHANQACRAALALQDLLQAPQEQRASCFPTRIGLHTGEVLVGNVGTPSQFAYTVVGDGVNLASGLEALNKVYGTKILASEDTRRAAGDSGFEWRRVDHVAVKGRTERLFVYELLGRRGEVPEILLRARDTYEAALVAMLANEASPAVEGFERTLALRPDDPVAEVMLERARVLRVAARIRNDR